MWQRDQAIRLAATDFPRALEQARGISTPRHRAQALAGVARFAPEPAVLKTASEAVRAADGDDDPYRRAEGRAWAVRALAVRGLFNHAAEIALRTSELAGEISHPVNRLDALFSLWLAAWRLDWKVRQRLLARLEGACGAAWSWKAGRALCSAALLLASQDPDEARRLVERMPEGRYRRQALRRLDAGEIVLAAVIRGRAADYSSSSRIGEPVASFQGRSRWSW